MQNLNVFQSIVKKSHIVRFLAKNSNVIIFCFLGYLSVTKIPLNVFYPKLALRNAQLTNPRCISQRCIIRFFHPCSYFPLWWEKRWERNRASECIIVTPQKTRKKKKIFEVKNARREKLSRCRRKLGQRRRCRTREKWEINVTATTWLKV